jgi:hypothetical protein
MTRSYLNKKVFRHLNFLALLFIIFSFISCNPARKIIKQPVKEEGADYVFELLKKNELKYQWLCGKFSASIDIDGKEHSINGQVRTRKDSIIWVTLSPALGIEIARILISQDSVKFLNRIDNTYLCSDFKLINDNLNSGFDFDMLQALFVGNDLSYYENDKFKASVDDMMYRLNTIGRRKLRKYVRTSNENLKILIQSIWVDPENGKIRKVNIKELNKENKKLEVEYSGFIAVNNQLFPSHIKYKIDAEKKINISLEFSRVKIDEPTNLPFTIPEKYTRMQQQK